MSQAQAVQRLMAMRAAHVSSRKPSEILTSVSRYFDLLRRHRHNPTPEIRDLVAGIRKQLTLELKVLESDRTIQGGQPAAQAA